MPKTDPSGRHSSASSSRQRHSELPLSQTVREAVFCAAPENQSAAAQSLCDLESAAGFEDDIYYKIVPADGGKVFHALAYWKRGKWAGYYVYAACFIGDLPAGLAVLARRVGEVRIGIRRPTLDQKKGSRGQADE